MEAGWGALMFRFLVVLFVASCGFGGSIIAAENGSAAQFVKEYQAFLGTVQETGVIHEFDLVAAPIQLSLGRGKPAMRWAYNGQVPGPTFRVKLGDRVKVTLTNKLPQATTIHWHGVRVPNKMDGVPFLTQTPVQPDKKFTYDFIPQDAGTYWFHPHVRSHEQVERGLFGVLIVEDENEPDYDQDIVWVLDDILTEEDGSFVDQFSLKILDTGGRLGNILTVNGSSKPVFEVRAGERVRLRLVNVSNARNFRLSIPGLNSSIIAVDGNLVGSLQQVDTFNIVPGNRVDIDLMVPLDFDGQTIDIANTFFHREAGGGAAEGPEVMARIAVKGQVKTVKTFLAPTRADIPDWKGALDIAPDFEFDFDTSLNFDALWTDKGFLSFTINNKVYGDHDITALKNGRFYRMRFTNGTGLYHPVHIHGVFFKVLARDGIPVNEPYFRDTALLDYDGSLEIGIVPADLGEWLSHCHLLEHAALGMKTTIDVTE
ncbi:MAG: multicopper oxidase family protein [Sneathiella sp.]|nr:multicopper oxidase family protein [Sneathiella sp.]